MHMVVNLLAQMSSDNNLIKGGLEEALWSHLKVHLRFHFKNHKKLQNISRKRCIWRYSKWFIWQCSQGYTFESRYASFISYIEQNKQNCWHSQIRFRNKRSQVFLVVYRKRLMTLWVACGQLFLEVLENYLIFCR